MARQRNGRGMQRELAGARAHQVAAHTDVVAEIEQPVELEHCLADVVLADVNLQPLPSLLQLRESCLALYADGHDAPGDGSFNLRGFQLLGRERVANRT